MATSSKRFRVRTTGVAWRQTGDEAVVLDIDKSEYFGLSRSATRLWQLLQDTATRDEMVDMLMADGADVLPGRVEADVDAFLEALRLRHLLAHD